MRDRCESGYYSFRPSNLKPQTPNGDRGVVEAWESVNLSGRVQIPSVLLVLMIRLVAKRNKAADFESDDWRFESSRADCCFEVNRFTLAGIAQFGRALHLYWRGCRFDAGCQLFVRVVSSRWKSA